jgi:hypothetical protein
MLHFAPEQMVADRLSNVPDLQYVSADLMDASATVRVDITQMPFVSGMFDIVLCNQCARAHPRRSQRDA